MGLLCATTTPAMATSDNKKVEIENTQQVKAGNMIKGHIVVKGSEEPIPYAAVIILETGKGAVSDEDGYFRFKDVPAGKYKVKVQSVGYEDLVKEVTVSNDYSADINFILEESTFITDEVVVSANRNATSRKLAPVVVNVMSNKLFETVNSTDLAKSLNFQSGLRVENNCQNCGFSQVRINGLEGPYSQILINSRAVMSALSGVYGLEQIPVNMIERIEVVRGGGSALFGANAVGGTINIITKDPVSNSFQVTSTMSNYNGKSWEQYMGANASLVSKDNSYGIAVYQSYRNRNPYDHDGDGFSEIVFEATGIQTYEVVFHGIGGHASGDFAKVANPIHAAARAIAKISDFEVPSFPRTTYAVTNLLAGSYEAVHAIVPEALIRFNFRSDDQGELEKLRERIFAAIDEACKEETDRWGKDTITYTVKHICDVNAGHQDPHASIVEGAMAIAEYLGCEEPSLDQGGSTNCSRALEAGLPAVCLGGGSGYSSLCHTLAEQFRPEGAYKGCQAVLLLAILCAGSDISHVFNPRI